MRLDVTFVLLKPWQSFTYDDEESDKSFRATVTFDRVHVRFVLGIARALDLLTRPVN